MENVFCERMCSIMSPVGWSREVLACTLDSSGKMWSSFSPVRFALCLCVVPHLEAPLALDLGGPLKREAWPNTPLVLLFCDEKVFVSQTVFPVQLLVDSLWVCHYFIYLFAFCLPLPLTCKFPESGVHVVSSVLGPQGALCIRKWQILSDPVRGWGWMSVGLFAARKGVREGSPSPAMLGRGSTSRPAAWSGSGSHLCLVTRPCAQLLLPQAPWPH